jgi:4-alpha-glucanotransferase
LPLYRWQAHKDEKYSWWRQRVKKCVEIFHYFRIDHVLGFFRIYSFPWVPERNQEFLNLTNEEAEKLTEGRLPQFLPRSDEKPEWAEENCEDGRQLLTMILNAAGGAGVVAEDLGSLVPDYVRPLLKELGIPGFTIPYWELNEDRSLKE